MPDRDPAFLWETEALRRSPRRRDLPDPPAASADPPSSWVTLREAHHATGIPIDTLRKWARKGAVPSFLDESGDHALRMVRMDAVLGRAEDLGRSVAPMPPPADPASRERAPAADDMSRDQKQAPTPAAPEGTMIVPIAAWDKMLMQLGNLHEAGQQLAEARERAAKAETEAAFLRERLGELRRERAEAARRPVDADRGEEAATPPETEPEPEPEKKDATKQPEKKQPEKLWRYIYRGWKERRRH